VVFFLDDLQWASKDTLQVLEDLLNDSKNTKFLLLTCHHHGFELVEEFKYKVACSKDQINLEALSVEEATSFLAHCLKREENDPELIDLVHIVLWKTGGNAFDLKSYLELLQTKQLLKFDLVQFRWTWKHSRSILSQTNVTDQVGNVVVEKIGLLPPEVQRLLLVAAVLGTTSFDTETLQLALEASNSMVLTGTTGNEEMEHFLQVAVDKGLLEMIFCYKYKFSHDKVKQASEALVQTPQEMAQLRKNIGLALLHLSRLLSDDNHEHRPRKEKLFLIAVIQFRKVHLLRGDDTSDEENLELAELLYQATMINMQRSLFFPAIEMSSECISILDRYSGWSNHYQLMIKASTIHARALLACGRPENEVRGKIDKIIAHGRSIEDLLGAYDVLVHLLTVESEFDKCLQVCLHVLSALGVVLPRRNHLFHVLSGIVGLKRHLKASTDRVMLELPLMTDSNKIAALRILSQVVEAAFFAVKPTYLALAVIAQLKICWKDGLCEQTSEAYSHGAMLFGQTKDYESAWRMGQLSNELARQNKADKKASIHDGLAIFVHSYFISHWSRPYRDSLDPLMESHELLIEVGGFHKAWYPLIAYALVYFASGLKLEPLATDLERYNDIMRDCKQAMHIEHTLPLQQMIANFMGKYSKSPLILSGDVMDEESFLDRNRENMPRAINEYVRCKMLLAFFFHDYEVAADMSKEMPSASEEGSVAMLPIHFLVQGLVSLALAKRSKKGPQRRRYCRKAKQSTRQIETWLKSGNPNCHHMLLLLKAEKLSVDSKKGENRIRKEYDDAIASAARSGAMQWQALGNELAALHFASKHDSFWATHYFLMAYELYEEYGAFAKCRHIEQVAADQFQIVIDGTPDNLNSKRGSAFFARERVSDILKDARSRMMSLDEDVDNSKRDMGERYYIPLYLMMYT
jgi:predicted ATPase